MRLATHARAGLLAAAAISITFVTPTAQTPTPSTSSQAAPVENLKFEVASIKLLPKNNTGMVSMRVGSAGNTFTHLGSIRLLIQQGYQAPGNRQIGAPDWIVEDSYSITARFPEGVTRTPENTRVMVRALLADRFKLAAHEEEREMPVYALVMARGDKRLGPKLKPVTIDCQATPTDEACRQRMTIQRGSIQISNALAAGIASQLEQAVGRPVVDRTGLTGRYNVDTLSFASEAAVAAGTTDLPSIFTAVQEELGLKLESQKAPLKVVVIDSIQRPTED